MKVLLTSAGGRLSIGFTRGLKAAPEQISLTGVDADPYSLQRSEISERYLIPRAKESSYIDTLNSVIDECGIDLVTVQLEAELLTVSANRHLLHAPVFLPRHETMVICDSKWETHSRLEAAGVPVPGSMHINNEADLEKAFERFGHNMWIRALNGTGGNGSMNATSLAEAKNWINLWNGWGNFMAAELLSKETSSWESVWNNGTLVACQVRKRLRWEFANLTISGVTGITGASETVTEPEVERVCKAAVLAVDPKPHGIMGVDVAFDANGTPKVTEINGGRFMSGGVILFAQHGFNFPYSAVKTAMQETVSDADIAINPFPDGMVCVRGVDVPPTITTREAINRDIREARDRFPGHDC